MLGRAVVPLLALLVGLAVPAGQLRLIDVERACCCPDPDDCRCPDHDDDGPQPSIRACHSTEVAIASAVAPVFTPPAVAELPAPATAATTAAYPIDLPHSPPAPRRPDAPS